MVFLIHAKFSDFNLILSDRLEILPHFFVGEAFLWFTLNKDNISSYMDFCHLFARDYLKLDQSSSHVLYNGPHPISALIPSHRLASSNSSTPVSTTSTLSPTITKALIDRFVKDPIKFYGAKDNVITWLDEIEQQFKIMHLTDLDKLNLLHLCLKGEAYQWYKHYKAQFTSWTVFTDEIMKSFTSHLQRDLAFKKLKLFHQTVHQSVLQYYSEMVKLMQQADPHMSESTKTQYLMNGLRPSLSIETRRNYPNSTQEFLEQARTAEELTALATTFASSSMANDDFTPFTSSSYSKPMDSSSTNQFYTHPPYSHAANRDYSGNYSSNSNDPNQPSYLNRISKASSSNLYDPDQSYPLSRPESRAQSLSNAPPSLLNDNSYRNNTSSNQQQSFQRCFKCNSLDHIARQCPRFAKRNQ